MTTSAKQFGSSRSRRSRSISVVVGERLDSLGKQLRAVPSKKVSAKSLHDLRVASRRAEAALRLCQDAADSAAWDWLRRKLKKLRRVCNQARDDDVLSKWIKDQDTNSRGSLHHAIRAHRQTVQPTIAEFAQRLSHSERFERRAKKVTKQLQAYQRCDDVQRLLGLSLLNELVDFVRAFPSQQKDESSLHRLRIAGKRLRYSCELVSDVLPDVNLASQLDELKALQDRLGTIHDLSVGVARLENEKFDCSPGTVRKLIRKAQRELQVLQQDFCSWWPTSPITRLVQDTVVSVLKLIDSRP